MPVPSPTSFTRIHRLARPVPLAPGHSRVMVHGVASDASKGLIRYWQAVAKSANTTRTGEKP
jgi:hypothetical protein